MEKSKLGTRRSPMKSFFGDSRHRGHVDTRQTEYLTRLTSLRDSLIDQEQLSLAKAVERLRLQSLSNRNKSQRLRMTGDDGSKSNNYARRTNMMTTVEKFRQMRPRHPPPVILPLQGKQIFDRNSHPKPSSGDVAPTTEVSIGTSTDRSRQDETSLLLSSSKTGGSREGSFLQGQQSASIVRGNGRRAQAYQNRQESKTQDLLNMRSRVYEKTGRSLPSPFLPIYDKRSLKSSPSTHTSPSQTQRNAIETHNTNVSASLHSLDIRGQGDIPSSNGDLQMYCHDDHIVCDRPERQKSEKVNREGETSRSSRTQQRSSTKTASQKKQWKSSAQIILEKLTPSEEMVVSGSTIRADTIRSSVRSHSNDRNTAAYEYIYGNSSFTSDQSKRTFAGNGGVYDVENRDECQSDSLGYNEAYFPAIYRRENTEYSSYLSLKRYRRSCDTTADTDSDLQTRHIPVVTVHRQLVSREDGNKRENPRDTDQPRDAQEIKPGKKQIIVDMSSIIFTAPSPDPDRSFVDDTASQGQHKSQDQSIVSETSLRKVVKQQELRRRELTNLLEDVKKLNMKTEALQLQSTKDVALQENVY